MRFNTGQFLRHEYESTYGTQRRVLWANRLQWRQHTNRSIKSEIQATGIDVSAVETLIDIISIIHSLEPKMASSDQLILGGYNNDKAVRNCPECARLIYHSFLYQLPWLEYCPIHQCQIVQHCPDCGLPWPKPHECRSRRCATCSVNIDLAILAERLRTGTKTASELRQLATILATPLRGYQCALRCSHKNYYPNMMLTYGVSHSGIDIFDPYYPALLVQENSHCLPVFADLQVALPKLSAFCFTRQDYLGNQDLDEAAIFDTVTRSIRRSVLHRYGFDVVPVTYKSDLCVCQENVIRKAWRALHFVVKRDRGDEITGDDCISTQDFNLGIYNPPMLFAPTSKLKLVQLGRSVCNGSVPEISWAHETLPTAAMEIIYKASLWCLFRRLVEFYDHLGLVFLRVGPWSSYSQQRVTITEFERKLPKFANPLRHTDIHLCVRVNSEQISLTIPTEYHLGSLDELSLKTPTSPQLAPEIG